MEPQALDEELENRSRAWWQVFGLAARHQGCGPEAAVEIHWRDPAPAADPQVVPPPWQRVS